MIATQQVGLSEEVWRGHSFSWRILKIGNELHRAGKLGRLEDRGRRRDAMERVLALTDLTIAVESNRSRLRDLLRWRESAGESYLAWPFDPVQDRLLLRVLFQLSPESAPQLRSTVS